MRNLKKAQKWLSKALFLLGCVITPLLLFSCASGKSVQNNTISHRWEEGRMMRDSTSERTSARTDTYAHDSILVRDSIVLLIRGDTVYRDAYHERTITKTNGWVRTDTIYRDHIIYNTDTVRVTDNSNQTKEVVKKQELSVWQKVRLLIGDIAIFFILYILFCLVKNRFNH